MVRRRDVYRRGFDLVASAVLVVLTLPVLAVALVGSVLALRAWPLFTQDRVGQDGRTFRFLKVRTLPVSVPAYTDKHHLGSYQIPAFCRLLRSLHLDELPQLFLVLRGRMSLVGPRPEMPNLHAHMSPRFAAERTRVRPGCTGLWQISASCSGLISAAPEYDRFYLAHRSLRFDVWVLFRTALTMTRLADRLTLTDVPRWVLTSRPAAVIPIERVQSSERPLAVSAVSGR